MVWLEEDTATNIRLVIAKASRHQSGSQHCELCGAVLMKRILAKVVVSISCQYDIDVPSAEWLKCTLTLIPGNLWLEINPQQTGSMAPQLYVWPDTWESFQDVQCASTLSLSTTSACSRIITIISPWDLQEGIC